MSNTNEEYIPALSYRFLTPFFDFIQKYIVRDTRYKSLLIQQANIQPGQAVLDLGCGTGTLAIMAKEAQPSAEVTGLDADSDMLKVARYKSGERKAHVKFDVGFTNKLHYHDASFGTKFTTAGSVCGVMSITSLTLTFPLAPRLDMIAFRSAVALLTWLM